MQVIIILVASPDAAQSEDPSVAAQTRESFRLAILYCIYTSHHVITTDTKLERNRVAG